MLLDLTAVIPRAAVIVAAATREPSRPHRFSNRGSGRRPIALAGLLSAALLAPLLLGLLCPEGLCQTGTETGAETGTATAAGTVTAMERALPPPTRQDNVVDILHGVEITDPYRWLEDQVSPETRAWIDAQNAYTTSVLGKIPAREEVRQELAALMRTDAVRLPVEASGRYFFEKRLADQDLYVIYMREGLDGPDQVLIDPHTMSADHSVSTDIFAISKDGKMLAYGVRKGGEDETSIRFLDVDGRRDLPDILARADYYEVRITPDNKEVYYSKHSDDGPHVLRHTMGTDPAQDVEVFGKAYGPEIGVSIDLTDNGRWLIFIAWYGSASKSDIYYWDLTRRGFIVPIVKGIDASFEAAVGGDHLFMRTDWNAPNGRILSVDLNDPRRESWKQVVPEAEDVIESFSPTGGKLFVTYAHAALSTIKVFGATGDYLATVDLPSMGSASGVVGRWESAAGFFSFSSFNVPRTIYRYVVADGAKSIWWRSPVPFQSDRFEVKQVWYRSKDSTEVPMFLASRKDIALDGSNPVLLESYGGFRSIQTPYFSSLVAAWMNRGGVYALPGIRGGNEFGEQWHRDGMLEKKQNTFDDFIAAGEWLVANGYTSREKLAITGGSNGGLLVGAAMTQRPDLFKAVVCWHPLLDMIRYHRFLVASFWVPEYGSSDDPEQFKYIYAYSPYHRVVDGVEYPAMLMISGDGDTRVDPLHARKMVARLQAATASDAPVLLKYDTKAGHMGGKPLTQSIEDEVDEMQFLLWQLGMTPSME
jgi:prolyl oligopeptidase